MSYHAAQGLFAALASVPGIVLPHAWLTMVMGQEPLGSKRNIESLVALVMRLHNDTVAQLERGDRAVCPAATDVEGVSEWCWGYTQGLELDDSDYGNESGADLDSQEVIDVLAGRVPASEAMPQGADESSWLAEQRAGLFDHVLLLHRAWADARVAAIPRPPAPEASAPVVGRNDPCPCGSGKKYKKCCAS